MTHPLSIRSAAVLAAALALTLGAAAASPPLRIGAVGYLKDEGRQSVTPLVKYLEEELRRPVRLAMYPGYMDIVVQIAAGELDLAILPPIVFFHVHETMGTRTLAYGVYPNGLFTYRGVILARKGDRSVRTLADLRGKKVGFVDPYSASGYVYAKLVLAQAGVGPKEVEDMLLRNHVDVIRALDDGRVAAAASYEQVFEQAPNLGRRLDDYHVLATTEPIPAEAIVATSRLDEKLADRVKDLLLGYYERRKRRLSRLGQGLYIGFVPPDPSIMAGLRAAYEKIVPEHGKAHSSR